MAIKGTRSTQLANDRNVSPVKFRFKTYTADESPFYNNDEFIDFVTHEGNLYVCVNNGIGFKAGAPDEGFLLLVEKGAQGRDGANGKQGEPGPEPDYRLGFDGKKLAIWDEHGVRKAVSGDLTGPVWVPQLENETIRWVKKSADDTTIPPDISLEDLRPIKENPPVLFRLNSDNAKRSDEESGPGYYIQWKREGQEEWTNLVSISELMNLALAGVCFWDQEDPDGINRLHFGHRRVLKATYDSQKIGNRKIAEVELDERPEGVLFDAGAVPYPGGIDKIKDDVSALTLWLCQIKDELKGVVRTVNGNPPDCNGDVQLTVDDIPGLSNAIKSISGDQPDVDGNYMLSHLNIRLKVDNEKLYIEYNHDGHWDEVGDVGGSGSPDAITGVEKVNNKLKFTKANGTFFEVDLPSGGSGDGITNINFRVSNDGHLEYQLNNGTWITGPQLPSGGGADLNKIKLRIRTDSSTGKKYLEISRDSGITYVEPLELPSGSGSELTSEQVQSLISSALSNYYTKSQINTLIGTPSGSISYKPFSVYKRTASSTTPPAKPNINDWKWYVSLDNQLHSASDSSVDTVSDWTNSPESPSGNNKYLWVSWNTFESATGTCENKAWDDPICMTGESGQDGQDGDSIKFIFKLASGPNNIPNKPSIQAPNFNDSWSDDAEGVDIDHKAEFYCYSKKVIENDIETWSTWQGPYLWSVYGEDGVDGAGVEYIYYRTGNSTLSSSEKPSNLASEIVNGSTYQNINSEFVPKASDNLSLTGGGTLSVDWTDNPSGVSSQFPYEFVSCRKYKFNGANATEKSWSPFSEPTVWAHFGQDGDAIAANDAIIPISTTVTATNEHTSGNDTVYDIAGTVTWRLSHNGSARVDDYCTVYLGASSDGLQIFAGTTNNNGLYSATIPANTESSNLFLHITWYDGSSLANVILDTAIVPVLVQGPQGNQGPVQSLDGPVMRVTEWQAGKAYYDGNTPVNGINYLDVVLYEGDYYKCISSITATQGYAPVSNKNGSTDPEDWTYNTTYWTRFAFIGDAAFNTMIANNAYIRNLTSKQVVITDYDDTIVGGMTSSSGVNATISEGTNNEHRIGDIRIWAGPIATNGDLNSAPFTVDHEGVMKATKGYFGNGSNGIWIDGSGIVQFGNDVNIPTPATEGYRIGVTGTSMLASNPTESNGTTTYTVMGVVSWELYKDGVKQTGSEYCSSFLGGSTSLASRQTKDSSGKYFITVTNPSNPIVETENNLFINIIWYSGDPSNQNTTIRDCVAIPISIKGDKGDPGSATPQTLDGPIMRLSDWTPNTAYRNGVISQGEAVAYLDVVKVTETVQENGQSVTQTNYYKCTTSHTSSSTFAADKSSKWLEYYMIGDAAFNSLISNNAYINNLTSKQIVITDNNTVVAGMASGSSITSLSNANSGTDYDIATGESVRIWAGPITNGDLKSAPFRVTDGGHLYATNATVSGNVTANSINIGNNSVMNIRIVQGTLPSDPDPNTLYIQY